MAEFGGYPKDNLKFNILKKGIWWNVDLLQTLFRQISIGGPKALGFGYIEGLADSSFSFQGANEKGKAPFSEEEEFAKGDDTLVYICASSKGWAGLLASLRNALQRTEKDKYSHYEKVMHIVSKMEQKLENLEGVYNRKKFNEEFLPTEENLDG